MGDYMKNFGYSLTSVVVSSKFVMVQMHLNASEYSLNSMCQNCHNYPTLLIPNLNH